MATKEAELNKDLRVVGCFGDEEAAVEAIKGLRHAHLGEVRAFAPFLSEKVSSALGLRRSPVRLWILTGGIIGNLSGWVLTIGLSVKWSLYVGNKPIISIPPFVIISFELMILTGAIFGVIGFLVHSRFPRFDTLPAYNGRFSEDCFGVIAHCVAANSARAETILREHGAQEVWREEA